MTPRIIIATALIGLGVGGLLLYQVPAIHHIFHAEGGPAMANPKGKTQPVPVEVEKVKKEPITNRLNIPGTLVAYQSVTLVSQVQGKVASISFTQGALVEKGDILVKLDPTSYVLNVQEAKAQVAAARASYERSLSLYTKGFEAKAKLEKAEAELKVSEARLEKANYELSETTIRAPFPGIVGLRPISVGTYVDPRQELVTLVQLDPVYVDFSVSETYVPLLLSSDDKDDILSEPKKKEVDVLIESFDEVLPITAKVIAWDAKIGAEHALKVRAVLDNKDKKLRPGMYARVALEVGRQENALVVPISAVVEEEREKGHFYVYTVLANTAVKAEVTLGLREQDKVQIIEGIKEGDTVITSGHMRLEDGMPVAIKDGGDTRSNLLQGGILSGQSAAKPVAGKASQTSALKVS